MRVLAHIRPGWVSCEFAVPEIAKTLKIQSTSWVRFLLNSVVLSSLTLLALIATLQAEEPRGEIAVLQQKAAAPFDKLTIVVASDDWGDASKKDVLKVLYSSARPLWKSAGEPPLHAIEVESDRQGPMVVFI